MSGAGGWLPAAEAIAITVDPTTGRGTQPVSPGAHQKLGRAFLGARRSTSFRKPAFAASAASVPVGKMDGRNLELVSAWR
jgi:hypothetical protein